MSQTRLRAAIGLVAAYAIALQMLFAAFAPLPAGAHGLDLGQLSAICFGSGNTQSDDGGEPGSKASGKFHCVLCAGATAGAALLPDAVPVPNPPQMVAGRIGQFFDDTAIAPIPVRTGAARAPPLTM